MRDPGDPPSVKVQDFEDIHYGRAEGIARIAINRPEVRNAFRPQTIKELLDAFAHAREDPETGVVILTGEGDLAFCSGGDQRVRGDKGYVGLDGVPRLNVLDLQKLIRSMAKPVVAMVAGYAIGGGHVLHVVCDLTIAADNAVFGQTGPKVGSFDGGFGASYLARMVGPGAREAARRPVRVRAGLCEGVDRAGVSVRRGCGRGRRWRAGALDPALRGPGGGTCCGGRVVGHEADVGCVPGAGRPHGPVGGPGCSAGADTFFR
jgi:hypothetical protein